MDAERLREVLDYDPETGVFTWKCREGVLKERNTQFAGKRAGYRLPHGYRRITVDKVKYYEHRLVWLYVYGAWPMQIDHINMVRDDNRIANLRLATTSQNMANQKSPKHNTSGFKGVSYDQSRNRWFSTLHKDRKLMFRARFDTAEEAAAAYAKAAKKHFGEFARTG